MLLGACPLQYRRSLLTAGRQSDRVVSEAQLHAQKFWSDHGASDPTGDPGGEQDKPVAMRENCGHECPVELAAALVNGVALETIMRFTPALWQQEAELPLLLRLMHHAMETPSEACVAQLMGNCTPLQRRLLPLMLQCVDADAEFLLPILCRHARIDTEHQDEKGDSLLHALTTMVDNGNSHGITLLHALLTTRPRLRELSGSLAWGWGWNEVWGGEK